MAHPIEAWLTPRTAPQRRLPMARAVATCAPGEVVAARDGADEVCVFRLRDGRCFQVPDRCPHDGGALSDGFVEGEALVCGRHQWAIDSATGRCSGDGRTCVPVRPVDSRRAFSADTGPGLFERR